MLADFYGSIRQGLKHKLGCVLFQLPPQLIYSEPLLEKLIINLDMSYKNVFEFRHKSWWNKTALKRLKQQKIIFSGISYPGLPDDIVKTAGSLYYRLHGIPVLYKSGYAKDFLVAMVNQLKKLKAAEAWIYFNNTWGHAAIENAKVLKGICSENGF
jgi:uncharacterized protein YecE (DUF72 family)